MRTNLPTDLLRTFLAIVDTGSMMRATDHVFLTPSAVSLQMKRLEDMVNRQLFRRSGRLLALTPAGRELVGAARRILELNDQVVSSLQGETLAGLVRLGLVQDFADTLLPDILRRFSALHPSTQLQLRVAGSADLIEAYRASQLDIALCIGRPEDEGASQHTPMVWLGAPALADAAELPLVLLEAPCLFRAAALRALQESGRRYRIAVETPSLSATRAAVEAGLGVTCRTGLFAEWALLLPLPPGRLPDLPHVAYTLLRAADPTAAGRQLAALAEDALAAIVPPPPPRASRKAPGPAFRQPALS
jgi:DNA-binding transcriptional LysR family regulator